MNRMSILTSFILAVCSLPLLVACFNVAIAQVMSSSNYQIQSDSINAGGGFSTSTSYQQESTVGELATGPSQSGSFKLKAGYQTMSGVYLALTGASAVNLTPSIPGVSGGTANGSTTVRVTTDSQAGYSLSIEAAASPAMQKGIHSIPDYVPAGAAPDFTFTITAADAYFGYSPEGVDTVSRFRDNGAACAVGVLNTSLACWDGLATSPETIARASSANHPAGATTSIRFRVGVGGAVAQPPGTYTATTTITAIAL